MVKDNIKIDVEVGCEIQTLINLAQDRAMTDLRYFRQLFNS